MKNVKTKLKRFYQSHIFFILFSLIGSVLFLLIVISIMNMFMKHFVFNIENFFQVISDEYVIRTIFLTFYASLLSTLIAIGFGIPLAYIIAKYDFYGKSIIESIINLPLMIPHSVAGLLIYSIFMRSGLIGAEFYRIGIVFEDHLWGIVVALLFVSMPIFINNAIDGFKSVDPHLERVAYSLGAKNRHVFFKIMLPLSKRSLFSGAVMCWARGISEFGAVILIAYYPMIAPVLVYYRFNTQGLSGSAPIALFLIIICFFIFLSLYLLTKKPRERK